MLAHFGANDVDGDDAVAADAVPQGRGKAGVTSRVGKPGKAERRAGGAGHDEKTAARQRVGGVGGGVSGLSHGSALLP